MEQAQNTNLTKGIELLLEFELLGINQVQYKDYQGGSLSV